MSFRSLPFLISHVRRGVSDVIHVQNRLSADVGETSGGILKSVPLKFLRHVRLLVRNKCTVYMTWMVDEKG